MQVVPRVQKRRAGPEGAGSEAVAGGRCAPAKVAKVPEPEFEVELFKKHMYRLYPEYGPGLHLRMLVKWVNYEQANFVYARQLKEDLSADFYEDKMMLYMDMAKLDVLPIQKPC